LEHWSVGGTAIHSLLLHHSITPALRHSKTLLF
jgi:hypothetical protein